MGRSNQGEKRLIDAWDASFVALATLAVAAVAIT
jgi:hypothetical protein